MGAAHIHTSAKLNTGVEQVQGCVGTGVCRYRGVQELSRYREDRDIHNNIGTCIVLSVQVVQMQVQGGIYTSFMAVYEQFVWIQAHTSTSTGVYRYKKGITLVQGHIH